jgi:nucleoside-diphosphate-sugar epimerase
MEDPSSVRVLLTGANGFVGRRIAVAARASGWEVIGVGRSARSAEPELLAGYLRHDLRAPLDWHAEVDAVVHCAALATAWASPKDVIEANVTGTRHVLAWARQHGCPRLVFVSSTSVLYRDEHQFDLTEDSPVPTDENQITVYSRTKAVGERLVATYPGPWAVVRPRAVFGPGDTVLLPRILRAARWGVLPRFERDGDPPVTTDLTYVDNVAHDIVQAVRRQVGGILHATNGEPVELYPFLDDVLARMGVRARWRRVSPPVAMGLARAAEWVSMLALDYREPPLTRFGVSVLAYSKTFDVARTRAALGPCPVPLDTGVERLVAAWRPTFGGRGA